MHIVHLETGRHLYGGARQVLLLAAGLDARGVSSRLIATEGSEVAEAARKLGIDTTELPMGGDTDVGFALRLRHELHEAPCDLLHVHSRRGADVFGGLTAHFEHLPAVLSRRVDNPDFAVLGTLKYRAYDRIIAISDAVRQQLLRQGMDEDKVTLVPSAVDAQACQPRIGEDAFREQFGFGPADVPVASVGQLIPRKGHEALLEVWPQVLSACPRARLVIFGQGAREHALVRRIEQLHLEESVQLAGFREDLLDYLGHFRLLVHPALQEGLGLVLLEAQAAGVPVVAYRSGGVGEAVADGHSGILVELGDIAGLVRAMGRVLTDEPLRERLAAGGPAHIAANFSADAMIDGNLAVYREVMESVRAAHAGRFDERVSRRVGRLADALTAAGTTLATAESCTGGWLGKVLTDRSGSSAWYAHGVVSYSNAAKTALLDVDPALIGAHGAVSREVAEAMARGAHAAGGGWSVAITGIAGPDGGSHDKPVGTVWIGWCDPAGQASAAHFRFAGDRDAVRRQAVESALDGLLDRLG